MARVKKRKMKKKTVVIIIIILLLIIGFIIYKIPKNSNNKVEENKVVSKIPKYGYNLKSNKSDAYKNLFQELKTILSEKKVDEKKYVKKISEMFIVDFFSLNDHIAKTDVGGVEFVHNNALENFTVNAEDTYYKYVESNIYKQRKQKLPTVDKVTIKSVEQTEFEYGDSVDEKAYEVTATWTYKDSKIADGYQNEATLIFVHEGKKLVLVELSEDEEE